MRRPAFDIFLVFRRVITGERGGVVREFDHDVARAALAFDALELAAADDEAPAEFLEDRGIGQRIVLVAFIVVNVDARDPVALRHIRYSLSYSSRVRPPAAA